MLRYTRPGLTWCLRPSDYAPRIRLAVQSCLWCGVNIPQYRQSVVPRNLGQNSSSPLITAIAIARRSLKSATSCNESASSSGVLLSLKIIPLGSLPYLALLYLQRPENLSRQFHRILSAEVAQRFVAGGSDITSTAKS